MFLLLTIINNSIFHFGVIRNLSRTELHVALTFLAVVVRNRNLLQYSQTDDFPFEDLD